MPALRAPRVPSRLLILPLGLGLALGLALGHPPPALAGTFNRVEGSALSSPGGGEGAGPAEPAARSTPPDDAAPPAPAAGAGTPEGPSGDAPPADGARAELEDDAGAPEAAPAEPEPPRGEPTFGTACMYGADGGVLYAPQGKTCRAGGAAAEGDEAADAAASGGGRCIYGRRGEVLHAPSGAACSR